jgi:DNA repair protein RadD
VTAASWRDEARTLRRQLSARFPALAGGGPGSALPRSEGAQSSRVDRLELRRASLRPPLFDYQLELGASMLTLVDQQGRGLLSLPTGAGKTRTAANAVLEAFAESSVRQVVWLAPTIELIDQAFRTFEVLWRGHGATPDMILTRTGELSTGPTVWLTTPQSIYARIRRRRQLGAWDLVVFDEAHQLAARTYREAVERLLESGPGPNAALVGLSATPGRADDVETEELVGLFGGNLLTSRRLRPNPIQVLQRRGVLARLRFRRLTASDISSELEADRLAVVFRAAVDLSRRGRRVLVFTASVGGAIVLAELLRSHGVSSEAIHADMDTVDRFLAIDAFASGNLQVLTNQRLLATGYDCPAVADVILAAPVRSSILFEQMVGRAARGPRTGGASEANIWEFDDHLSLHGLPQSYYRFRFYDWS